MVDLATTMVSLIISIAVAFILNYLSNGNFLTLFDWLLINMAILTYAELLPFFIFIMFLILDSIFSMYSLVSTFKSEKEVDL